MRMSVYSLVAGLGLAAFSSPARAQTWADGRTTPRLGELVAVDATGERRWPFGAEDVAGDGLDTFGRQEQSRDLRSVYAAADAERFWARVYVSDPQAVANGLAVYVFVDSDDNTNTGGGADAVAFAAAFDTDPTPGGYDYVLGLEGSERVLGVWEWDRANVAYEDVALEEGDALAEAGVNSDPLFLNGNAHGYLQGSVDLAVLGLTPACRANVYVRSVEGMGAMADGDLDVGRVSACHPADANDDQIADIAEPDRCEADEECPARGVCVDGECVLPHLCGLDRDCDAGEVCRDGRCLARGGDDCSSDRDCNGLVCSSGECVACTMDGMCSSGRCGPDGRCTGAAASEDGILLAPDEEVQGGALTCAWRPPVRGAGLGALLAAALAGLWAFRKRRG